MIRHFIYLILYKSIGKNKLYLLIEIDRDKAALASGLIENGAESALMLRAAAGNQRKDFHQNMIKYTKSISHQYGVVFLRQFELCFCNFLLLRKIKQS